MGTRPAREISDREIAIALLIELAQEIPYKFSLLGFYEDDENFLEALTDRLKAAKPGSEGGQAFLNKLRKVCRRLVQYGVLHACMTQTAKEYLGEPSKQMEYFLEPGKAHRLHDGARGYNGPQWEAEFMLRHAYPKPESAITASTKGGEE